MTLTNGTIKLEDSKKLSKVTRDGIRIIGEMSTPKIVTFVIGRHRVGLLSLTSFASVSYIAYDKIIRLFI